MARDRFSIEGKFPPPEEHAQLLVVGAGAAGTACAIEAAKAGLHVMLVDENPVAGGLIGTDVPLFYGQRATGAVQNAARMTEQILQSNPALAEAFELGVDVRLGTTAWGCFVNGPALHALPGRVAGLADETRSWLCGFDALVLATGARDLVLSFDGINQPGVMGANALHALLARYDAFAGRRVVILGSGALALSTAWLLLDHGLEVAALVEVRGAVQGDPVMAAALGVEIFTGHVITGVEAGADGVRAARIAHLGAAEASARVLACDTICLAIGLVPVVDLADVLGCRLVSDGAHGGFVPLVTDDGATTVAGVFAAGDGAGLGRDATADGARAARAALAWLGNRAAAPALAAPTIDADGYAYRLDWQRALMESGGPAVPVCLCEEVTRGEVLGLCPPRYLGWEGARVAAKSLQGLQQDGPLHPDQVKRLTRAGMGPCQGRRCREQVALLVSVAGGVPVESVPLASYRAPVRPLPLGVLATANECAAMRDGWDLWMGMATQWIPYADIGTAREAEQIAAAGGGH